MHLVLWSMMMMEKTKKKKKKNMSMVKEKRMVSNE